MPRILLVEDEQVNREMFRRRLTARGFEVLTAEDGAQAVAVTTAEHPEAVLMDLGLPVIDGWEATRRIKANPATAGIPVIALSAHATADAKERAFAAGCVDFETKPVQLDRLVEKLHAVLATAPGAPPPPVPPAAPPPEPPPVPVPVAVAPEPEPGGADRRRILVVEDNDANRVMLCRRLNKQGFLTVEARDGREALDLASRHPFDLVLLDIMMPEVDGYQVLQELKSDPDLKELPVIMISALDEMASVVRCIEGGAEDYLPKPYDPVLLHARVKACLDKKLLRDQELAYFRAVAALTRAAAAVETGDFDAALLAPVADRADALGTLARVFDKMAREVQARERQLRQEVQRLRVEIDLSRKDAQVKEITEDGFFRELQVKAAGLRRRFRKDGPAAAGGGVTALDAPLAAADTLLIPKPDLGLTRPPNGP